MQKRGLIKLGAIVEKKCNCQLAQSNSIYSTQALSNMERPDTVRLSKEMNCKGNTPLTPLTQFAIEKKIMTISKLLTPLVFLFAQAASAQTYNADVWADNWFSLSVNGELVAEDSVPITTERSFNAESFSFTAERPFVLGLIAKDFKENDTGLEYIGTRRQQMGDGGVIVQIKDETGNTIAVTDDAWTCLVIHRAPLNKACESEDNPVAGEGVCEFETTEEPADWNTLSFDASDWSAATIHSESAVSPKQGYDRISWDSNAELIWGPDLETDNTLLCRLVVE